MAVEIRRSRPVLVLDGDQRAALAVVRSLGRAGYPVDVGAVGTHSLAGASRHSRATIRLPAPLSDPVAYREALKDAVRRAGYAVVIPVTEPSALALLDDRDLKPLVPFPSSQAFHQANDKVRLLERARTLEVDGPAHVTVTGLGDEAVATWERFPAVVKPGRSVVGEGESRLKTHVAFVSDREGLRRALAAYPPEAYPVMIQERLEGSGVGIFLLLDRGERVAHFAHRRLREVPPEGGVSVYRESIRAPAELVTKAERLLRSFDWTGVGMVEFKHDAATGRYCLMEINGRFWGSLQLAVDSGVDFPRLLVDRFLGLPQEVCDEYRLGIRSRWLWGDVDHLIGRMRRGGARGGLATWFRPWWPGDRFEVLRIGDPGPFVSETRAWLRHALRRAR